MNNVNAGVGVWTSPKIQIVAKGSGASYMCAVADNKVYCWGSNNTYGQLGTGDTATISYLPRQVNDTNNVLVGKTITAIAVARTGTVCVVASNVPYCWGRGGYGTLGDNTTSDRYYPSAVTTSGVLANKVITDISGGEGHVCVVASGAAYCWGANNQGQLGDNSTTQRNTPVAVNTTGVLSGKTVTNVALGSSYSCATASGSAYCWGYDGNGYLGNDASYIDSSVPVAVDTSGVMLGKTITTVQSGVNHVCALASDSTVFCWGEGSVGQLGNNGTSTLPVPVQVVSTGVLSGKTLTNLSSGNGRNCVIDTNKKTHCWGQGPVGDGSGGTKLVPVTVTSSSTLNGMNIDQVAVGSAGICFLNSLNRLYCNSTGTGAMLGNNTADASNAPVQVLFNDIFNTLNYRLYANADSVTPGSPLATINSSVSLTYSGQPFRLRTGIKASPKLGQISVGNHYSCGLSDGRTYCWGNGGSGRMGNNSTADSFVPVSLTMTGVLAGKTIQSFSAEGPTTCGVASDNKAYCWGYNGQGQLGNNSTVNSSVPVAVSTAGVLSGKDIIAISTGHGHVCAIASDNNAYCWGLGGTGQMGNNASVDSWIPVAVTTSGALSGKSLLSLSAGRNHTCAIASDNKVYCWGFNASGQLGNNSTSTSSVPVAVNTSGVLSGKTMVAVASGRDHTCATASDGSMYCWGSDSNGQLGNNSTTQSTVPVAVNTAGVLSGKTIRVFELGDYHTCAIASDAQAYCWGLNTNGQLGNNSTTQSTVPVAVNTSGVLSGKTIDTLSAGDAHACVTDSDDQAYCWGYNDAGQLGNNSTTQSIIPVTVLINSAIPGATINVNDNLYKLQFAEKNLASCSVQTGFTDVTESTAIAYNTNNSVSNGASITTNVNDPVPTTDSVAQTYIAASGSFTNTSTITGGKTGLWDFSLRDNTGGISGSSYCLRIAYNDGAPVENTSVFPEIDTTIGILSVGFVDGADTPLTTPTIAFNALGMNGADWQQANGSFTTSSRKLRIYNDYVTNGWSVSLAATGGATALWNRTDNLVKYDFNDSSGAADGSDSDLLPGVLTVSPNLASVSSSCSTSGVTPGAQAVFDEGITNSIVLMSATSGAAIGCNFDLVGVGLSQVIPAGQLPGTYTLDVTATVVAL